MRFTRASFPPLAPIAWAAGRVYHPAVLAPGWLRWLALPAAGIDLTGPARERPDSGGRLLALVVAGRLARS